MEHPTVRTKEWVAAYNACLREFSVWEFGQEAYAIAAKAADAIIYPKEPKEKDHE